MCRRRVLAVHGRHLHLERGADAPGRGGQGGPPVGAPAPEGSLDGRLGSGPGARLQRRVLDHGPGGHGASPMPSYLRPLERNTTGPSRPKTPGIIDETGRDAKRPTTRAVSLGGGSFRCCMRFAPTQDRARCWSSPLARGPRRVYGTVLTGGEQTRPGLPRYGSSRGGMTPVKLPGCDSTPGVAPGPTTKPNDARGTPGSSGAGPAGPWY